jgi:hypothetical protein
LKINKDMLATILTYHQVTPAYLDFLGLFGFQTKQRDLHFTGFREYMVITNPIAGLENSGLGRSGQFFQLCYNLKSVWTDPTKTMQPGNSTLDNRTFRQTAIHHQFDLGTGKTFWILTQGNFIDLMPDFNKSIGTQARAEDKDFTSVHTSLISTMGMHLWLARWAAETWRDFLRDLEDAIDVAVSPQALRSANDKLINFQTDSTAHSKDKLLDAKDLMDIQALEENANDVLSQLKSNNSILRALSRFYTRLGNNADFSQRTQCKPDIGTFTSNLQYIVDETNLQIERTRLLCQTTANRKALVRPILFKESRL